MTVFFRPCRMRFDVQVAGITGTFQILFFRQVTHCSLLLVVEPLRLTRAVGRLNLAPVVF